MNSLFFVLRNFKELEKAPHWDVRALAVNHSFTILEPNRIWDVAFAVNLREAMKNKESVAAQTMGNPSTGRQAMVASVDKSGDRVKQMFSEIAPRYDLLNHLLSMNIDRSWRQFTVKKLKLDSNDPVLDACTGTGDLALAIARRGNGRFEVIGADFCAPMLQIAKKKADSNSKEEIRIDFVEADTMSLPFPNDMFQATTVAFGLRNVSDTDIGLSELTRVTKSGGEVAILEFSQPTFPGLKQLYSFYFRNVLPRLGQSIANNKQSAYQYLPESVMQFPSGQALLDRMRGVGLSDLRMYPLTFGIATLYLGRK